MCRSYTAELLPYTLSFYYKNINKDGEDIDLGAKVDIKLTNITHDDDGNKQLDYSDFYDLDNLGELTAKHYASADSSAADDSTSDTAASSDDNRSSSQAGAGNMLWSYIAVPAAIAVIAVIAVIIAVKKRKGPAENKDGSPDHEEK